MGWSGYGKLSGVYTYYVSGPKRLTEYEKYLMKRQSLINSKSKKTNNKIMENK
jgi:hypothetical protein